METKFCRGKVVWYNRDRGLGRMFSFTLPHTDVTFKVTSGRRSQIIGGKMFYASESDSKLMPEPRVGDVLLFEPHEHLPEEAILWGFQRMFFLAIWNEIRSNPKLCLKCGHSKEVHGWGGCTDDCYLHCDQTYVDGRRPTDDEVTRHMWEEYSLEDDWPYDDKVEICDICGHSAERHLDGSCKEWGCECTFENWPIDQLSGRPLVIGEIPEDDQRGDWYDPHR